MPSERTMKYLREDVGKNDADCAQDAISSTVLLEQRVVDLDERIAALPSDAAADKAVLEVEAAALLLDLDENGEAFRRARRAFDVLLQDGRWEQAAQAGLVMFQADQPDSMAALGQAIWLSVTFPVDPELTVAIMQQVVDDTPDDSDGAAVAAIVASYVVDMRAEGRQRDDLVFFTNNLLGAVARRHSGVDSQEAFKAWIERLELDQPEKFLVRLRNIVDVMVQDEWWFDRDEISARIPAG
jgi:hypothetical protein